MFHLRRPLLTAFAALLTAGLALANPPAQRTDPKLQPRVNAALSHQAELLRREFAALKPQRPGVRDLYFVGFAGYGDQDVFRKEVERVRDLFDRQFGTRGHSMILTNNPATLERYPLATLANLTAALIAVSRKLDPKEDVLFLFITSHGDQRDGLSVRLNGRILGDIRPKELAAALAVAGIRNRVIVISACFSGQFVQPLANADSLVITAAAANRASFGCSTEAEWTYFGKGYFVDALPKEKNFIRAFHDARRNVTAREMWDQIPPSDPQIWVGSHIERVLGELKH